MTHQFIEASIDTSSRLPVVEVRLARNAEEIAASQRLRYRVFFDEMGANPSPDVQAAGMDRDIYDPVCKHLLALADGQVIGAYRLIDRDAAAQVGGFYSASEFDISGLLATPGNILELGRSCVDPRWRNRGTLQMLWQGLANYIVENNVSLLFGCASLPGTDAAQLAPQLAYLHQNHLADGPSRPRALDARAAAMPDGVAAFDARQASQTLPPLLKGYLRAGAVIGEGAVVDHDFNTTDVLVMLPTDAITTRYQRRYDSSRRNAA